MGFAVFKNSQQEGKKIDCMCKKKCELRLFTEKKSAYVLNINQ